MLQEYEQCLYFKQKKSLSIQIYIKYLDILTQNFINYLASAINTKNIDFFKHHSLLLRIILNFTKMYQHPQTEKQQEEQRRRREVLVAKFRQAFPPTINPFIQFISNVKSVGGRLTNSLSSFYTNFKNTFNKPTEPPPTYQKAVEEKIQDKPSHKGLFLNFGEFLQKSDQKQNQTIKPQQPKKVQQNKSQVKPAQNLKKDNISARHKDEDSQSESHPLLNQQLHQFWKSSHRRRLIRIHSEYRKDSNMIDCILAQTPAAVKHFNEMQNELFSAHIDNLAQIKQKREKEMNQQKSFDQIHKNYLKSLGINLEKNNDPIKSNHQKIIQMLKHRKKLVEIQPPRKKVKIEITTPPIYCVQEVMRILEMQKNHFFQEKRIQFIQMMKQRGFTQLQAQRQLQTQIKRLQEQKLSKQKQVSQKVQTENASKIIQKKPQTPKHEIPNVYKQKESQNVQTPVFYVSPAKQNQKQPVIETIQIQPKKEVQKPQQNLPSNNVELNKSTPIRQNPFLNRNKNQQKVPNLSLQELIIKQPAITLTQLSEPTQLQNTVGSLFFPQNTPVANLFNPIQPQTQIIPQPSYQQFTPLNNQIQPSIDVQNVTFNPEFNLFSNNPSPLKNSSNSNSDNNDHIAQQINTAGFNMHDMSFGENPYGSTNHFSNDQTQNRMFTNLFVANNPSTTTSLFANPIEQPKTKQPVTRYSKRNKDVRVK